MGSERPLVVLPVAVARRHELGSSVYVRAWAARAVDIGSCRSGHAEAEWSRGQSGQRSEKSEARAGISTESEVGPERPRRCRNGSAGSGRRSKKVGEHDPCERTDGTDHVSGLGSDDDGVSIGPKLRARHAASFGFARSAFVHRSTAAHGTTMRRLPSRTQGSPERVVRNSLARL